MPTCSGSVMAMWVARQSRNRCGHMAEPRYLAVVRLIRYRMESSLNGVSHEEIQSRSELVLPRRTGRQWSR